MSNYRVHLIAVRKCGTQVAVLLLDDTLSGNQRNLLHNTHYQFFLIKRFGQEVVCTNLESMYQILRCIQCREEDNGNILCLFVFLQDYCCIKTADIGHHYIKQNQVGMFLLGLLDTCGAVVGGTYLKFLVCQQYLQQ